MVSKVFNPLFLVVLTLLISACAQKSVTPTILASSTTAIREVRTSTPTRPATPKPTKALTPTPQEQVITYEDYGFRLALPARFQTVDLQIGDDLQLSLGIRTERDETQGYPLSPIGVRVFAKAWSSELLDWFGEKQGDCYDRGGQPPAGVYFISPIIENHLDFKGNPALQYESGCWPVPYETLIDRGSWVIALYYLRDYPSDYEADFNRILASLEFFEPAQGTVEITSPAPATPTPVVCLDENAQPIDVAARQTPLEVRFISDGNLWVWMEANQMKQQISETGDAQTSSFSPDGQVIAFTRGQPYSQTELWAINRDGSDLRLLVSADQLHAIVGEPTKNEFTYTDSVSYIDWLAGTHTLGFEVLRSYDAIGGCCESGGTWQVDVDSGELSPWTPPPELLTLQTGLVSPDGKQVAIVGETGLTLLNADGTNQRPDVLTYPYTPQPEGGGFFSPYVFWAPDSQSLLAITYSEDIWETDATFTTWWAPVDGSPPHELASFSGNPFSVYLSPNQEYLAYYKMTSPITNNRELHLAMFDGSKDVIYARGHMMEFWGWSPDGVHFIFGQFSTLAPQWGSVCAGSQPLLNPLVLPARQFTWFDSETFLFEKGGHGDSQAELRLGKVSGHSIWIGPFNGEYASYHVVPGSPAESDTPPDENLNRAGLDVNCSTVERLPPDSAEAQQILDEFVANFKEQYPTEYMGMAILHRVDHLGEWAVVTGSVVGEGKDVIAVRQSPQGYQIAEHYHISVPLESPEDLEKRVIEPFLERLPEAPQALFTCLDRSWLLAVGYETEPAGVYQLAYVGTSDNTTEGLAEINTIQYDGSNHTILLSKAMLILGLVSSPQGEKIAFWGCPGSLANDCSPGEDLDVWVVNWDGSNLSNLTEDSAANESHPDWSPDGQQLVFDSDRSGDAQLYIMNSDGSNPRALTDESGQNTEPKWSPNGQWIAYHCRQSGVTRICIVSPDGQPAGVPISGTTPVWSPSGSVGGMRLAFLCYQDGHSDICTARPDGSELANLTSSPADEHTPAWSPDGNWLTFVSNRDDDIDVYKVCATCPGEPAAIRLTDEPRPVGWPAWSPDGGRVAYVEMGGQDLLLVNADRSHAMYLASGVFSPPVWKLAYPPR